jgi:hypothetical protein
MRRYEFQPGIRYHDWELLREVPSEKTHRKAEARCNCGAVKVVNLASVRAGQSRSCGQCRRSTLGRKHGMHKAPEYRIWSGIKQRCLNPKGTAFHDYGGRGIRVCERWAASFENFFADMGPRPSPRHSVERREVNGDYEPGNCFWATPDIQARNKRGSKWKRIVLLLASHEAETVARMVEANVPDEIISSHIARVYFPRRAAA